MKIFYTKIIILGLLSLMTTGLSFGQIISQYVETNSGSTPKGIEIWNNTGATLDFSTNNLVVERYANGSSSPTTEATISSGTLADGEVLVIGGSDLSTWMSNNYPSVTFINDSFSFNGDDALEVVYGGTTTDVFGDIGQDPGSSWSGGGVSTRNSNIGLLSTISTGTTSGFTDPSTRFEEVESDPFILTGFGVAPTSSAPTSYCNVSGDTSFGTAITLVELGTISNSTGAGSGYDDFTSQSTSVNQGGSANLTVNLNTAGNYTVHAIAWIDWNQDFVFDTATEQYDLGDATNVTNGQTSLSPLNIAIPAGAVLGSTRMRIASRYDLNPTGPCDGTDDGEIEDYTINVIAAASAPEVGFDTASSTENETNTTFTSANIPISVTNYDGNQINIDVAITGGTAEPTDYTYTTQSLSFTSNSTQNITVDINDDADTDDETIIFTITETSSVTGLVISQATHTLTIVDDEAPATPVVLLAWDFNGLSGSEATDTSDTNDTNISTTAPSGIISRGSGNNPANNGNRFNANGWTETSLANAISANDYFEWTIEPNTGFSMSLTSIVFNFQRSGTGPSDFAIRSNQDGFATNIQTFTGLSNGVTETVNLTGFNDLTTAVTFRFYGWGSTNGGGTAGFEGTGNDLVINGNTASASSDTEVNFAASSTTVNEGDGTVAIDLSILNEDATNATSVQVALTTGTAADINNYTTQTVTFPAGSAANQTLTVTLTDDALEEADETLTFTLQNISGGNNAQIGTQNTFILTIEDNDLPSAAIPYNEDFSNCATQEWSVFTVGAEQEWFCDAGGYFEANAFGSSGAADDYLVSPVFDMNAQTNEVLTFTSWTQFADASSPQIELLYTTNFTGNPSTTSWNSSLNPIWPAPDSQTNTGSGNVDVSGIFGTNVVFAFRYTSTGTGAGTSERWRIEDFEISSSTATSITLSETTLTGLDYVDGSGPSAEQTFTAAGSNLTGNITLTAPTNFEISTTSGSGFGTSVSLTPSSGSVATTTIYVRLAAGLAISTYSGTLTATSPGATQQDVSLSGEVTAVNNNTCGIEIDFETAGGYTTSIIEDIDENDDYFGRIEYITDAPTPFFNGGVDGDFYFGAHDINGITAEPALPVELDINNIDISTLTNLEFSIDLAEDDPSDDWDAPDYVHIFYSIDGSPEQNLLWIESEVPTGFSGRTLIDTDFDGVGDGTQITDTFQTFTVSIPSTGSSMDIRIEFNLDAGDEDIALDNISVCGSPSSFIYTYTDDVAGWNINPITGTPPSTSADEIEVLAGTAVLDGTLLGNNLTISTGATLDLGPAAILDLDGNLTNDGTIIFSSDASGSAQFDTFNGTVSGSGDITVERHMSAVRAYRLISSSIASTGSINANWQEGATSSNYNPNSGFGTHITGTAGTAGNVNAITGLDETATGNPSLFTFDNTDTGTQGGAAGAWETVTNTLSTNVETETPYLLMVRGDRSTDLTTNTPTPTETVLRTTGSTTDFFTGTSSLDGNTGTASSPGKPAAQELNNQSFYFSLIANPYQAVVDYTKVTKTGLSDFIYVWDPNLGGSNPLGGYVTYQVSTGIPSVPSGSTDVSQFLAPGMAFFVQNGFNPTPTLIFEEDDKATAENQVGVFSETSMFYINSRLYKTEDLQGGYTESDALGLRFSTEFTTAASIEDGEKLINPAENYAVINNGLRYIDNQNLPEAEHSIDLYVADYTATDYSFTYDIENMPEGMEVALIDAYLGTQTILSDDFVYQFSVDEGIPESVANNRFSLVFNPTTFSTSENNFGSDFSLYPNPATNGVFSIKTPKLSGEADVEISNLLGQQVYKEVLRIEAQQVNVNAAQLSDGMYMVTLTQNGQSYTTKLIIN